MPLVGAGLATAAAAGEAALNATTTLGQELANALGALSGAASQTKAAVALEAAQMATVMLACTLAGSAGVKVELSFAPGREMTPPITANLLVGWDFNGATINPNCNSTFGARPTVTFDTVTMDLSAFMGDFITPLIEQVNTLLDPIRPVLEINDGLDCRAGRLPRSRQPARRNG